MRATLRITWLLLSLSSLFPSIYANNNSTIAAKNPTDPVPTGVASDPANHAQAGDVTKDATNPPTKEETVTATPPSVIETTKLAERPTTPNVAEINPVSTSAQIPVTVKPEPSPSQAVTEKKNPTSANPSAPPTTVSVTNAPPVTVQAATPASNISLSLTSAPVQTESNSVATRPPDVSNNQPGNDVISSTTVAPGASASTEQPSRSFTSKAPETSSGHSSRGESAVPTTARPTQPQTRPSTPGGALTTPSQADPVAGSTTARVSDTRTGTTGLPATTAIAIHPPHPPAQPQYFSFSLNNEESGKDKHLVELCKRLMPDWQNGNCTLKYQKQDNKVQFDTVEINGKVRTSVAAQYYEEITKEPTDNKTLIAILASCGALLIMIVILAVCASHHRKPYNENQQHLTEELNTVENGYHDNPTLEVMEVQPEMQEKKLALNGEFNDSWIVPIDNLMKDDIPDEEDTHL